MEEEKVDIIQKQKQIKILRVLNQNLNVKGQKNKKRYLRKQG
jgi:hypothetical protein